MTASRRSRWRRWLVEATLVVGAFVAVRGWQQRGLAQGTMPSVALVDLEGDAVALAPRSRPTMVHFMASWCGVCSAVEPSVASIARDHDVVVVASQSGEGAALRRWIDESALRDVRIVADPDGRLARAWGVQAFPTSFFVDEAGQIRMAEVGYATEVGMRLRLSWIR